MSEQEQNRSDIQRLNAALDGSRIEWAKLAERIALLEKQMHDTMLEVLRGLKGPDDGTGQGLYEQMRASMGEISRLGARLTDIQLQVNALAAKVTDHETDRQQVIGGGRAVWFIISGAATIGAFIGWLLSVGSK